MVEAVAAVEQREGVAPAPGLSLVDRVGELEKRLFGGKMGGSLRERIERVKGTAVPPPASSPPRFAPVSPDPAGGSASSSRHQPAAAPVPAALLTPLANLAPPRFFRVDPANPPQVQTGDYFGDVMGATKGKVFRFKNMPIPVYISPYQERAFTDACIRGFELWEVRTDGAVRFVQVDDPEQARIRVIWSRLGLNKDPKGCTLGAHTIMKWKEKGPGSVSVVSVGVVPVPVYIPKAGPKYSVPPQVIEVNLDLFMSKHPEVRYLILQNVVAHELGHALGLLGHSPHKTDLMFSLTDEHSRLSARDINTLRRLYEQKVDVPL